MEPLAATVGLWERRLRFHVFDVIYRQIKPMIMLLHFTAVLRASVGQYPQHWQALRHTKWQYTVIQ